jgi:histidinol-phosphate aminotransferase
MSTALDLIRPEVRRLKPYRSAQFEDGCVRLNANENPWRPPGDGTQRGLNWYPEPRPLRLQQQLAAHYGISPARLLVTRGSSEAIDVAIRGFCRPGADRVVICPPTFGMYGVYAQLQVAAVRSVPLRCEDGYSLDVAGILDNWTDADKLLFLCSPNNPTGNRIPDDDVRRITGKLRGRGCVILDAAYAEFSDADASLELAAEFDNLLVLRTLSKAMGLAGARCGALIGSPPLVDALSCILPPYTFPAPCAEAVERCLEPAALAESDRRVATLRSERQRMETALARCQGIRRVWPSAANFLLIEAEAAPRLVATARKAGILLRDFSWDPYLPGCVRITIGTPEQNDRLLQALG